MVDGFDRKIMEKKQRTKKLKVHLAIKLYFKMIPWSENESEEGF